MKPSSCLVLLALFPLGCGGATPAPTGAEAIAVTQRPAEVTVVDLSPAAPPAPKEQKLVKAAEGDPSPEEKAAEYGIIGLLNTGAGGDPDAPTAAWGKDDSADQDALAARGNMWGGSIGDSFGAGGLGLAGTGGGGTGAGIGLGTIGHGSGTGTGQGFGSGASSGAPRAKPPQVKMGAATVAGRLPQEIIQRIVRQNFGRFRLCYENGLRSNPKLAGKVAVRFTIGKDGAVSGVALIKDTTLPDASVSSCVTRAFNGLSFPQPDGGEVVVNYPILFSPAEDAAAPAAPAVPAKPAAPAKPAVAPATSKSP